MNTQSNFQNHLPAQTHQGGFSTSVDYSWFDTRFASLLDRIDAMENTIAERFYCRPSPGTDRRT